MESQQQRALHKLYHAKAIVIGIIARYRAEPARTDYGREELGRALGAKASIIDAIELLQRADQVDDEFQVELPWKM